MRLLIKGSKIVFTVACTVIGAAIALTLISKTLQLKDKYYSCIHETEELKDVIRSLENEKAFLQDKLKKYE